MRILAAFLVAPLVVALGWSTPLFIYSQSDQPLPELVLEYLVTNVAIYLGAATFTVLFCIPLFVLFRHFNLVRRWTATATGAFIGGVAGIMLGNMTSPLEAVGLSVLGGLAGLAFWYTSGLGASARPGGLKS